MSRAYLSKQLLAFNYLCMQISKQLSCVPNNPCLLCLVISSNVACTCHYALGTCIDMCMVHVCMRASVCVWGGGCAICVDVLCVHGAVRSWGVSLRHDPQ